MQEAQLIKYDAKNPIIKLTTAPAKPVGDHDLLVETKVAAINPLDNLLAHGDLKLVVPYKLPQTLGNEFVGIVKQTGDAVQKFQPGDRVYARTPLDNMGAFSEEIVINEQAVAKVPDYLTDEEAAAVPLMALTAMQAFDLLAAKAGQTLFISGGSGSFGAMAIPLAVARGLKVITTGAGARKAALLDMGVSQFIDYRTEDYTKLVKDVDLVIDTLGGEEVFKQLGILKQGGRIVSLRAMPNRTFAKRVGLGWGKQILFGLAAGKIERQAKKKQQHYDFVFVTANGPQLAQASETLAKSQVRPALGKRYSLEQVKEAMGDVAHGHSRGKVLIKF